MAANPFVSEKIKNNFWTRLLANTIGNPPVDVELVLEKITVYDLEKLKKFISTCIDKDDDVLTQFVEGDFSIEAVKACKTFEEILSTLNKYIFEVDETTFNYKTEWTLASHVV